MEMDNEWEGRRVSKAAGQRILTEGVREQVGDIDLAGAVLDEKPGDGGADCGKSATKSIRVTVAWHFVALRQKIIV